MGGVTKRIRLGNEIIKFELCENIEVSNKINGG